jgi:exoribonuclease R
MPACTGEVVDVVTIDPGGCLDMDDGFWASVLDDGDYLLRVAVANVSAAIRARSRQARLASELAFTRYRHEGGPDWHMLPKHLAVYGCSLVEHKPRPAVIFEIRLHPEGMMAQPEIRLGYVRNIRRLSYSKADKLARSQEPLSGMLRLAIAIGLHLQHWRLGTDLLMPKWSGEPTGEEFQKLLDCSLEDHYHTSHLAVAEFNILMNRLSAEWMHRQGIPSLYRNYEGDLVMEVKERQERLGGATSGRTKKRRISGRAYYGTTAVGHVDLSVRCYSPVSRPIRDYASFVALQQFVAALRGERLPYSREDLLEIGVRQISAERQYDAEQRRLLRAEKRRQRAEEMAAVLAAA